MEVICIGAQKGGVGKTYVTASLANALTFLGYKVLIIDMDKSGNLSTRFLTEAPSMQMYDVLLDRCNIEDIIVSTPIGDIAPTIDESHAQWGEKKNLGELAKLKAGEIGAAKKLRKVLLASKDRLDYDFCLIDTSADSNMLIHWPLIAADRVLPVAMPKPCSIDGLLSFLSSVNAVIEDSHPTLQIDGLIITDYSETSETRRKKIKQLNEIIKENDLFCYENVLRTTDVCDKFFDNGRAITDHLYDGNAASDALNLALEFLSYRGLEPRTQVPGLSKTEDGSWIFTRISKNTTKEDK